MVSVKINLNIQIYFFLHLQLIDATQIFYGHLDSYVILRFVVAE